MHAHFIGKSLAISTVTYSHRVRYIVTNVDPRQWKLKNNRNPRNDGGNINFTWKRFIPIARICHF